MLRGKPTSGAYFHDNVVVHDNAVEAVRLKKPGEQCLEYVFPSGYQYSNELCNLHVGPNRYNTDTINQLAVGDFDGDGRDDVFLANGTAWWYSSAGTTEWRFLLPSTHRATDLRFGHFNLDARTDVLFRDGVNWWVSMGGTRLPRLLRRDGRPLADCVFGHFDDDGITDVLWANGSRWFVSSGGTGPWTELRASPIRAANMRVGDFTADGIDEIFWIENDRWHLWHPTLNLVSEDVTKPVRDSDMASLVVVDFDGDGFADLAKTDGQGWSWLRGGTSAWAPLRGAGDQPEYSDIRAALLGRFTLITSPSRRLNAIRYASARFPEASRSGFVLWYGAGRQDAFVPWTPHWQEMR
jgi:FG-GAP-like repeat